MSESVKSASAPHPAARGNLYRAAIVGAASLKGKEIAEMLNERNFPAVDVRLLDDDEALGQLEAMGDEISFIQSVRAEQFEHVDFTFFASDGECTRKNWKDLGMQAAPSLIFRPHWKTKPGPACVLFGSSASADRSRLRIFSRARV